MDTGFNNKVAIITGGSSGIGRATALAFARKGSHVVIADRVEDDGLLQLIKQTGVGTMYIHCDVSKKDQVKHLIEQTILNFGRLDYAFNNAGIEGQPANVQECTEENWDETININLKGIFLCMKYEIPEMLRSGSGVIINCSSVAGLVGYGGLPAYVASKHGVIGLTKTAALECAAHGIRINAVCPGVIKTSMIDRLTRQKPEAEKAFAEQEPVGRIGTPEEVADAVIWLCSGGASFVTGHALAVDGGWVAK